ncbi:GIY-YIG nuclease family protein [Listeria ilorinensis]|uniref:GIY-YIG nuclease family protein n=1 Tax=Listeria ilorinensis TaxID=2867439 RepID=UPI001EF6FE64|nr:GIY-YIG nuclease family protein [Listeria ilorinensis]
MAKANDHYFYVLLCADGTYYGGYTTDVLRREREHNDGIRCKYTKTRRPVKMIHFEKFATRSEATKAEAAFKKLTRVKKDHYLTEKGGSRDEKPEEF